MKGARDQEADGYSIGSHAEAAPFCRGKERTESEGSYRFISRSTFLPSPMHIGDQENEFPLQGVRVQS